MSAEQLPDEIQELNEDMPPELAAAPMRLLKLSAVESWSQVKVYEDVVPEECVDVPYARVSEALWKLTAVLSWRWGAQKPAEQKPGFSPMTSHQFRELQLLLQQLKASGVAFIWVRSDTGRCLLLTKLVGCCRPAALSTAAAHLTSPFLFQGWVD